MLSSLLSLPAQSVGSILGALVVAMAVVALAWATVRTQALTAWRNAAEGYKEQVSEMTLRLKNAEAEVEGLHETLSEIEARPDLSAVVEAIEATGGQTAAEVVRAFGEMMRPLAEQLSDLRDTLSDGRRQR